VGMEDGRCVGDWVGVLVGGHDVEVVGIDDDGRCVGDGVGVEESGYRSWWP